MLKLFKERKNISINKITQSSFEKKRKQYRIKNNLSLLGWKREAGLFFNIIIENG